jgi:CRISPR-associated protein Csc1
MTQAIRLNDFGVRLFAGRLYNHDYLWFSSNEISKVSATAPFLHNYALCYALAQRSHRTSIGSMPKYAVDAENEFGSMPLYPTPAQATNVERTTITFNAVDALTLTTGDSKSMNTPNLGKRIYLNLQWESLDLKRPRLGYEFYVFTFGDYRLPSAFRLGKKGTPVRVRWNELSNAVALFREKSERPSHIINPLDVNGQITRYEPISIPPHLLMRSVTLEQDWFVFNEQHVVHVPRRVLARLNVAK